MIEPTLELEQKAHREGYRQIAGLDEAGRGSWAGPVAAAAVILPLGQPNLKQLLAGVRDSKTLSAQQREALLPQICQVAHGVGVGFCSAAEIDEIGIVPATRRAMRLALSELAFIPDFLLIDGLGLPTLNIHQAPVIKGDAISLSIAAASIVAKVYRDYWMIAQDLEYEGYGFAAHKGYGTRQHQAALDRLGPCRIHRFSFSPLRNLHRLA
jgi:ribonuclease HII